MSVLGITQQMVLAYAMVNIVAFLLGGIPTILLEEDHISTTIDVTEQTLLDSELASMYNRHSIIQDAAISIFAQSRGDTFLATEYAQDILTGSTFDVVSYYPNYYFPPPPGSIDGTNENYSFCFKHEDSYNTSYLNISSLFDNSLGPLYKAGNGDYQGLYVGFEDGFFRHFPYLNITKDFAEFNYTCEIDQTNVVGYDPRCRGWYVQAKAQPRDLVFSDPYIDASTGRVVITLSEAVVVDSTLVGVIGFDFEMQPLADRVLAATVGTTGYTYLSDGSGNLVLHPDLDTDSGVVQTVRDIEFQHSTLEEWTVFERILEGSVFQKQEGQTAFSKAGRTWHATYGPVNGTNYYLLMVVPEASLLGDFHEIHSVDTLVTVLIAISMLVFPLGVMIAHYIADKVSEPVAALNRILLEIAEHSVGADGTKHGSENNNDSNNGGSNSNAADGNDDENDDEQDGFVEIIDLRGGLYKVFVSVENSTKAYFNQKYDIALDYLMDVEEVFLELDHPQALGIIYNNRGNILRRQHAKYNNFSEAILTLEASVSLARRMYNGGQNSVSRNSDSRNSDESSSWSFRRYKTHKADTNVIGFDQHGTHAITLATRLSNLGDCFREAGQLDAALKALKQSSRLFVRAKYIPGQLFSLSNMGLVYQRMQNTGEAEKSFKYALELADEEYEKNCLLTKNIYALQVANMNMGVFYLHMVENKWCQSHMKCTYLELSLCCFYASLTLSPHMLSDVLTSCVTALQHIYLRYYDTQHGEGKSALVRLKSLYPKCFSTSRKVGAWNTINLGHVQMEAL